MGLDLATKKPGATDQTFKWILHTSGTSLAAGATISLGDGTNTRLWLSNTAVGVISNTGQIHKIRSNATVDRDVYLRDTSGELVPETLKALTTMATNNTVTAIQVTALDFTPDANAIYEFELQAITQSANTATGVRVSLNGPAQVSSMGWRSSGASTNVSTEIVSSGATLPAVHLGTAVPAFDTNTLVVLKGTFVVTGTPASPMTVGLYSEVAASEVRMMPGSWIRYRRLA